MTEIQVRILKIFDFFKELCTRYHLSYFAIGGTCIGAVRHKGFIPWDDDLDVAMPYEDYYRFITIAKKELTDPYELYLPEDHPHWVQNFIKIVDSSTTFVEKQDQGYPDRYTGIYIDIMPLYGLPKGRKKQLIMAHYCDLNLFLNRKCKIPIKNQPNTFNKVAGLLTAIYKITGRRDHYLNNIIRQFKKYRFDESDCILFGSRDYPTKCRGLNYKSIFFYEDFSDYKTVAFESNSMRIPTGYDRYLRMDFGDYMKLPSEEKQYSNHSVSIIDFNKSYKEYVKEIFR